jgi:hypothetical protein
VFPAQPFTYFRSPTVGTPTIYSPELLHTDGTSHMQVPIRVIPGTPSLPGWAHDSDEKTGGFLDGIGRLGTSLTGQRRFVMCDAGIEMWDLYGNLTGIIGPIDFLAIASTDLTAGMAVTVPSGTLTQNVVMPAEPGTGNPAVGLSAWTVKSGDMVLVRCGLLNLPTFVGVSGAATLASTTYYLAAGGVWTTTPGSQTVATRLGPRTVQVQCGVGGTGGSGSGGGGGAAWCGTSSGTGDAFLITSVGTVASMTPGLSVQWKADRACGAGPVTLQLNAFTAYTVKKSGTEDLSAPDILTGEVVLCVWDGTQWNAVSGARSNGEAGVVDDGSY